MSEAVAYGKQQLRTVICHFCCTRIAYSICISCLQALEGIEVTFLCCVLECEVGMEALLCITDTAGEAVGSLPVGKVGS